ncbi:transporter substrate-binding domain-containing protein [Pseudomonas sp. MM211]|uniref:transporter substrate-binding domain-containing protein n=1 Tax=Pseudomonas sp. MM211 TaxID=2866808 RepID=UPI001CED1E7A|nr:transporter substrate-binding domain-containing protein [Pseudomonas sp. MM211]UCJ16691.1 transporter substrate-binding domain-containing protein [Pseudomonas sp. MM211]
MSRTWIRHPAAVASTLLTALLTLPWSAASQAEELADGLAYIKERGRVAVCTTMAFPLFAYYDEQDKPAGLVHDLIVDVHKRLEARLEKPLTLNVVRVTPTNRIEFVRQGRCDFMVSTLSNSPERKALLDFAEPGFYRSGTTILALKSSRIDSWESLRGKPVCSSPTNSWLKTGERRFGIDFVTYFGGEVDSQKAVVDGRCVGLVAYDTYFEVLLQRDSHQVWNNFEIKLPSQDFAYWSITLRNERPQLRAFLDTVVADWHRSGLIIDLEKRYGIPANAWVAEQHAQYSAQQSEVEN